MPHPRSTAAARREREQVLDVRVGQALCGVGLDQETALAEIWVLAQPAELAKLKLDVVVNPREGPLSSPGENLRELPLGPGQNRPAKLQPKGRQDAVGVLEPRCRPHDLEDLAEGAKPSGDSLVYVQREIAGLLDAAALALRLHAEAADDAIDIEEQQRSRLLNWLKHHLSLRLAHSASREMTSPDRRAHQAAVLGRHVYARAREAAREEALERRGPEHDHVRLAGALVQQLE